MTPAERFLAEPTISKATVKVVAAPAKKTPAPKADDTFNGTRKLIRPHLPVGERRREPIHTEDPLSHALISDAHPNVESSHAEAFYFQKQIQLQTEMTFVLDDGDEIHGVIEWYDKCVVKVRAGRNRVMIYKAGIKYLYKTSDAHPVSSVMK